MTCSLWFGCVSLFWEPDTTWAHPLLGLAELARREEKQNPMTMVPGTSMLKSVAFNPVLLTDWSLQVILRVGSTTVPLGGAVSTWEQEQNLFQRWSASDIAWHWKKSPEMMKTIPINLSKGEMTASASQGRPSVGRGNTHRAWLSYRQRAALGDFLRDRTPWGQKRGPAAVTEDKGTCGDLEPEGLWSPDGKGCPRLRVRDQSRTPDSKGREGAGNANYPLLLEARGDNA